MKIHIMKYINYFFSVTALLVSVHLHAQIEPFHFSIAPRLNTHGKNALDQKFACSIGMFTSHVGGIEGVQVASLVGTARQELKGAQIAGLVTVAYDVKGCQISGLHAQAKHVDGAQIAGISSVAQEVKGTQIAGVFNYVRRLDGLQIGVINVVDSISSGGMLGILNIVRKGGYRAFELSTADFQTVGFNYKAGGKLLYSTWNLGFHSHTKDYFSGGFGLGHYHSLGKGWALQPEIMSYNYVNTELDFDLGNSAAHFRLGVTKRMGKHLAVTVWPSVYIGFWEKPEGAEAYPEMSSIKPIDFRQYADFRMPYGYGLGIGFAFL
jgi:hypothetical protein